MCNLPRSGIYYIYTQQIYYINGVHYQGLGGLKTNF